MLSARHTLLPRPARIALARDTRLGGGNLWRTALEHSRAPDAPLLVSDPPLVVGDGSRRREFGIAALDALADAWACHYLDRGVRPRDRVAIYIEDSFEDHVHLAALARIGAIAVLVNGRMPPELALGLMDRADPVGLYTDPAHLELLAGRHRELPGLRWTHTRADAAGLAGAEPPDKARYRHGDNDPIFLCHSSGTTGRPKLVTWTHRQSVAGTRFRLATQPEPDDSLLLCAAPLSHGAAIAITFFALAAGLPVVSSADRSAAGLSRAAAAHRPTTIFAFNHTLAELAVSDPDPAHFTSVTDWVNVGDSAHEAHVRSLVRMGGRTVAGNAVPGSVFNDILGSSELGWAALRRSTAPDTPSSPRHLGRPGSAMKVAVLREDGTHADVGEVGMLGVRGESVTTGYWNDSDTYHRSFLGGWFLSGDLVRRTAENHYFHVDRVVDTIHTTGSPGHSVLMEEVILLALPEAADCAVVAGGDRGASVPVAVVRLRGENADPAGLLDRANTALAAAGQPDLAALELAADDADLPVGATGKVLKRHLREKYRDLPGHLATAARGSVAAVREPNRPPRHEESTTHRTTPDATATPEGVRAIAAAVLETEPERITPDAAFHAQLEMDSLQKTEFVARVERAFGVRFAAEEAARLDCLADVLAALRRHGVGTDPRADDGVGTDPRTDEGGSR
ncbi:AMP-binding protein (plasmid) [Embleya sp. NBC_00888]|uniref:AMP-binding protein n=1 Tax=Embleya sp. NBC_00888 TaxID=2975960 RepID=UPI002F919F54|nr:AMP-binding protein [Embleya sp. NBC_00888]